MVAGCKTQNIGGNWICWRNVLFLQVYERLWILFPVIKPAGERKKKNLPCSSVGWSSFSIPLSTNYSLPIHLWVILLSCIRISILFFNLNAHGYIQQREERNRSLSISPCISLKKQRQHIMTAGCAVLDCSTVSPCWSAQAACTHKQLCGSSHCHLENVPLSVSFHIHCDTVACICLIFCKACCFGGKSIL